MESQKTSLTLALTFNSLTLTFAHCYQTHKVTLRVDKTQADWWGQKASVT